MANDKLSLRVPRGAIVGLMGPNGSGKTTLFNVVTGLVAPESGDVLFEGRSLLGQDPGQIARLGLVRSFQSSAVYDTMSCKQNMLISISHAAATWRAMLSRPARPDLARAAELLSFVGLAGQAEQVAGELSYGQRKLLEIAMALMGRPGYCCLTSRPRASTRR